MDTIEFIRTGGGTNECAKVLNNGVDLARRWRQAKGGESAAPLWTNEIGGHLEAWGPYGSPSRGLREWVPDGYAAVLTCSCGEFGCGGAIVRMQFEARLVTWSDFKTANDEVSVLLGKFTFGRTQYEEARNTF
jgi:hypothetical protein